VGPDGLASNSGFETNFRDLTLPGGRL